MLEELGEGLGEELGEGLGLGLFDGLGDGDGLAEEAGDGLGDMLAEGRDPLDVVGGTAPGVGRVEFAPVFPGAVTGATGNAPPPEAADPKAWNVSGTVHRSFRPIGS